ncbi:hypothetical protein KK137_02330 [Croceibacterium sp. LX-88]|jgi:hypothetical protein|uniref:DUF4398 domain-containing protein n=1 Tax=Croceibacterium selenioxidans TaxID=2838833 RepID=A0ABS5W0J5_9SPHN|nr:hypothetical protein [Croceibacterium selenioxidans]MBT2133159.1 hypothetical protein [Croceibacterium selenioxidans]
MRFKPTALPLLILALPLTACASASDAYPSLAIREGERVEGTMTPVIPPVIRPAAPAGVLSRVDQLEAEASSANQAFMSATPAARRVVGAARGQDIGSENWSVAQVALAGLEAERSKAMTALADLDRLYVDAGVAGTEIERIASARESVMSLVEQQDAVLEELAGSLR